MLASAAILPFSEGRRFVLGGVVRLRFTAVRRTFSSLRCPCNRHSGESRDPASYIPGYGNGAVIPAQAGMTAGGAGMTAGGSRNDGWGSRMTVGGAGIAVNMATRPNWKRCRRPVGHCGGGRGPGILAGLGLGPARRQGRGNRLGRNVTGAEPRGFAPSGQALWDDGGGRSRAGAGSGGLTGRDGRGRICIGLSFGTGRCGLLGVSGSVLSGLVVSGGVKWVD